MNVAKVPKQVFYWRYCRQGKVRLQIYIWRLDHLVIWLIISEATCMSFWVRGVRKVSLTLCWFHDPWCVSHCSCSANACSSNCSACVVIKGSQKRTFLFDQVFKQEFSLSVWFWIVIPKSEHEKKKKITNQEQTGKRKRWNTCFMTDRGKQTGHIDNRKHTFLGSKNNKKVIN